MRQTKHFRLVKYINNLFCVLGYPRVILLIEFVYTIGNYHQLIIPTWELGY